MVVIREPHYRNFPDISDDVLGYDLVVGENPYFTGFQPVMGTTQIARSYKTVLQEILVIADFTCFFGLSEPGESADLAFYDLSSFIGKIIPYAVSGKNPVGLFYADIPLA